jgi:hypothetical protein
MFMPWCFDRSDFEGSVPPTKRSLFPKLPISNLSFVFAPCGASSIALCSLSDIFTENLLVERVFFLLLVVFVAFLRLVLKAVSLCLSVRFGDHDARRKVTVFES